MSKPLTSFAKKFFSILAAGTFALGGIEYVEHDDKVNIQKSDQVVDTLELYKDTIDVKNNQSLQITAPKNSMGRYYSYDFNSCQTILKLENAVNTYYKYNTLKKCLKNDKENEAFENSMRTIFDLNIEFVEIENTLLKQKIASELNTTPEETQILFELDNISDKGIITIKVDNTNINYDLSPELDKKIKEYKRNILLTQGIDFDTLYTYEKKDLTDKILNNISSSRSYLIDYFSHNDIKLNKDNFNLEITPNNSNNDLER